MYQLALGTEVVIAILAPTEGSTKLHGASPNLRYVAGFEGINVKINAISTIYKHKYIKKKKNSSVRTGWGVEGP